MLLDSWLRFMCYVVNVTSEELAVFGHSRWKVVYMVIGLLEKRDVENQTGPENAWPEVWDIDSYSVQWELPLFYS